MRLLLLTIAFLVPVAAQAQESAVFRDWHAECDRFNDCTARFVSDADPNDHIVPDYRFVFARNAYETHWTVSFIPGLAIPAAEGEWMVTVDQHEFSFLEPDSIAAFEGLYDYYFLGSMAQDVVDTMVPGSEAAVYYPTDGGEHQRVGISLSGLAAALLWVDERQQRVGSERVVSLDDPAGLTKVTSRTPEPLPGSLASRDTAHSDCEALADLPHGDAIESHRLDARYTLHMIPCWAGAYNFSHEFYLQDEYGIRQLAFADYSETNGWGGTAVLVNPYFDPRTLTLSAFAKGRGLGDCGTTGFWRWNEWSFKLLEYTAKGECSMDGEDLSEPGDFPVVYRAPDYAPPVIE